MTARDTLRIAAAGCCGPSAEIARYGRAERRIGPCSRRQVSPPGAGRGPLARTAMVIAARSEVPSSGGRLRMLFPRSLQGAVRRDLPRLPVRR